MRGERKKENANKNATRGADDPLLYMKINRCTQSEIIALSPVPTCWGCISTCVWEATPWPLYTGKQISGGELRIQTDRLTSNYCGVTYLFRILSQLFSIFF